MVTRKEFERVREIIEGKSKPRAISHNFAFTGLIRCGECGAMITAEKKTKHQKNGNVHKYTYYHCTKRKDPDCEQGSIDRKNLEKQIKRILGTIEIPAEFREWAVKCIKEENKKESQCRNQVLDSQQQTYKSCINKIDALIDMRANGEITENEFLRRKTGLNEEKFRLEDLLKDTGRRIDNWVERAESLFLFAERARYMFKKGGWEAKRQILSCLGSNLLLEDGKLSVSLQKPLLLMEKYAGGVQALYERLEPTKNGLKQWQLEVSYSKNPLWGGLRDDVRTCLMDNPTIILPVFSIPA